MLSSLGQVISFVLLVCILVLLARFILDWVQLLARSWRPTGAVAVLCEGIYTVTDPPLRVVRRVIPPIRLGGVEWLGGEGEAGRGQRLAEGFGGDAVLVGQQAVAAGLEQGADQLHDGRHIAGLVDEVSGEDEQPGCILGRVTPVEDEGVEVGEAVGAGVFGRESDGGGVVIAEGHVQAEREGDDAGEAEAAADLEGTQASGDA